MQLDVGMRVELKTSFEVISDMKPDEDGDYDFPFIMLSLSDLQELDIFNTVVIKDIDSDGDLSFEEVSGVYPIEVVRCVV